MVQAMTALRFLRHAQPRKHALPAALALWLAACCIPVPTGESKGSKGGSVASGGAVAPAPEPKEEVVQVAIKTLLKDYKDNEVRADGLYKGKTLQVSGKISDISVSLGKPVVQMNETGEKYEIPSLSCHFGKDHAAKVGTLAKGNTIKVVGKGGGMLMHVLLRECEIVD